LTSSNLIYTCHSLGGRAVFCPWRSRTDAAARSRRSTADSFHATSCPWRAAETCPQWADDTRHTSLPTPGLTDTSLMTSVASSSTSPAHLHQQITAIII